MNFPARRKPFALIFCYGFASFLAGAYSTEALAQAPVPLRVDPVLLGLPPIKPAEAPAPAAEAATAVATTPAPVEKEKARAEVKPVEAAVVEARPVEAVPEAGQPAKSSKASAQEIAAPTVAPQVSPSVTTPVPPASQTAAQPVPQSPAPVRAVPAQTTRPVAQQQAQPSPAASPASSSSAVSSLAPLRVDPALLGLPPVATAAVSSPASAVSGATRPAPGDVASAARVSGGTASTASARSTAADKSWFRHVWDPLADAYNNGALEFYLPLETYHLRSKYTAEKIATYQEHPLGFGFGRGLYNENGNWEGIYAMAFQDSHFKPMYMAGYGWKAIWRPADDVRLGLGYTAALMSRTDIFSYIPFPVVLPMASVAYKNFSLEGTFVPGGQGNGNIFFIWAKWELGKTGEAVGTPARPAPPAPTQMANTSFGAATPPAYQRVPYGPALEPGSGPLLASAAETVPPRVPATGSRDEEEVSDALPALDLRSSKAMTPPPKDSTVPRPVFLSAHRMGGAVDREFIAEGDAELRKIGTALYSDRLTYWPIDDEVEAEGSVRLEQGEDLITGPKMRLKMEDQVGFFEQPAYTLKRQPQPGSKAAADKAFAQSPAGQQGGDGWFNSGFASPRVLDLKPGQSVFKDSTKSGRTMTEARGEADRIDFEGENQVRLTNATYTTCPVGNDDWYTKVGSLKLDYDREVADGTDGTVYFLGTPILYSPWLSFSLNNERKSGFLAPTFGTNSDSGIELSLPYYWNIAPNMDATITPRVMTKRGVQVNNEFRYLDRAYGGLYRGQVHAEFLPDDKVRNGENRYGVSLQHLQTTASGITGQINYNKVSDDNYYTDLSSRIASTAQTQLLQQGLLSYGGGGWWNATANFQSYQTLQPDAKNPVLEQYRMLPQITVNARKPDLYMTDSSFLGQYTAFSKPKQIINGVTKADPDGQRVVLYPQVALPYITPGWYVTPKVGVNATYYALSGQPASTPDTISRTLPIFSVDSGMTFERPSNWFGRDYMQTLEPRLYYLNIPYQNQDKIPIFDTARADFNFAQIFSENQFSGWDRINNANQLTAAMSTRLLEPSSGSEIMRAMLGQRFYFTRNKVELNPSSSTTVDNQKWEKSDVLAAFSGQILPRVFADAAWEYNLADRQLKRYSMGARYQPEPGKVLNAAYRYNRDASAPIDQVDVSGQWPISGRWHVVGRINYSFKDDGTNLSTGTQGGRLIESIAGVEYNGGCWVVRGVVRRLALTQDNTSTAFFIQLELNDFSRIGSNPLNILKRNIQGYSLINQSAADPVFGE